MKKSNGVAHIAVLDVSQGAWPGGAVFSSVVARSLARVIDRTEFEIELIAHENLAHRCELEGWGITSVPVGAPSADQPRRFHLSRKASELLRASQLRRLFGLADRENPVAIARKRGADVLLPVTNAFALGSAIGIGWIPDFQHVNLPQFFTKSERAVRDRAFRRIVANCRLVMLSSNEMQKDLFRVFPEFAYKSRVVSFPSALAFERRPANAGGSLEKYGLPQRFALVINQFWQHKNHLLVVEAVRLARDRGVNVPLVLVGTPADHRDPLNKTVSEVLQAIATARLRGQVWLLGQVPREDLVDLLRCAAALIQPSRCEGWSTSVQDAIALDRPVLCSDLPVLREQAPRALGFFSPDSAGELSEQLAAAWGGLAAGPSPREANSIRLHLDFAREYGDRLLSLCREALGSSRRSTPT